MNTQKRESKTRRELKRQAWKEFLAILAACKTVEQVEKKLSQAMSGREKENIALRIAGTKLLQNRTSYRKIRYHLGLAPATISAVRRSVTNQRYESTLKNPKKDSPKINYPKRIKWRHKKTKYGNLYFPQM